MYVSMYNIWLNFFFRAEDGIRYGHVTGVQTCALPISPGGDRLGPDLRAAAVPAHRCRRLRCRPRAASGGRRSAGFDLDPIFLPSREVEERLWEAGLAGRWRAVVELPGLGLRPPSRRGPEVADLRDQAVGSSGDGFRGREPDLGTAVLRQGGSGHGDRLLRPDAHRGQPRRESGR